MNISQHKNSVLDMNQICSIENNIPNFKNSNFYIYFKSYSKIINQTLEEIKIRITTKEHSK